MTISGFGARRWTWGVAALIVLAGLAAYANSLRGGFVYLDGSAIVDNPSIRHLADWRTVLAPPADGGLTVGGRPLVNLSLAVNYALGGLRPAGYHAFNLAGHLLAGLVLFGIVRRTLAARGPAGPALAGAGAVALGWTVHPLGTEAVAYVIQRAESLMVLAYLLTMYCFIRYADGGRGARGWAALSVLAAVAGMATKEVMVSAPLVVGLYDWTFARGPGRAPGGRRVYYGALAASWIVLAGLVAGTGLNRGGTAGFNLGFSWWGYVRTQFPAVVRYLELAVWPHPLDFYYTPEWRLGFGRVALSAVVVAALAVATGVALRRRSPAGFLGFWFFAILAPTSLVPGMSQTMAEHRMYLALVPVLAAMVWLLARVCGRFAGRAAPAAFALAVLLWAAGLGLLTARRTAVYRNELSLWADTVEKSPDNAFAQNNLGIALAGAGRSAEAAVHFREALVLRPDYPEAENNLGLTLAEAGRPAEAIPHYERALALKSAYAEAEANLGFAYAAVGRGADALRALETAVRDHPDNAEAHNDLAVVLAGSGRLDRAISEYTRALALQPDNVECRYNLANALAQGGQWAAAAEQYRRVLARRPSADAYANLGSALARLGRPLEAIAQYERALALNPNDPDIHHNLGLAQRAAGQPLDAEIEFAEERRWREAGAARGR